MAKQLLLGSLVGLIAAALALALWRSGRLEGIECATWAVRVRTLAASGANTPSIKLILLDQASLDWAKHENKISWPWLREAYAYILDFCARGGARCVAFDVLYTEPSVWGVPDDEALGAAIRRSPAFIGAVFLGDKSGDATNWMEGVASPPWRIEGLDDWLRAPSRRHLVLPRAAFPVPELATNMTLLAGVNEDPDRDGILRRASLFHVFDGRPVPTLGFAAFLHSIGNGPCPSIPLAITDEFLCVAGGRIPLDRRGKCLLRFRGPAGVYETFNAAEVIQAEARLQAGEPSRLDPAVFTNACVFLGFSAPGLLDLRPTPVSAVSPGVFVHATLLDNLLSRDAMRDAPPRAVVPATLALGLLAGLLVAVTRKAWHSALVFVLVLPVPAGVALAAYRWGFWWPFAAQELAAGLAMLGAVIVNYATEGRQKAFIKQAFRFYLGPEVIEQILDDPSRLRLGGERRELTLFFSDIEKFSTFSEKLEPPALTALLNDYLTEMGGIIREEGGYLDKYIGDAIVAFWNAPLPQPDHAARAVRAALRCQRRIAARRPEWAERYGAVVRTRIGLNTGEVVVGNMGSRERFNYTVLGDAANLASRLEGANKAFGTYLMMAARTRAQAGAGVLSRELGLVRVVGRQTPVRVFEPLAMAGGAPAPAGATAFEQGLALCREGQWPAALAAFERLPDDPAAAAYAARCRSLLADPAIRWDGIWNLTEK